MVFSLSWTFLVMFINFKSYVGFSIYIFSLAYFHCYANYLKFIDIWFVTQYMFPFTNILLEKICMSIEMVKFSYQLDRPQDAQIKHYFWVYLWGCFQRRVAFKLTDRRFPSPIWVNIIQFLENPNIFSIYIKICQNKIYNINSLCSQALGS